MKVSEVLRGTLAHPLSHRLGYCPVCGHTTTFLCLDPARARNNMYCVRCVSSARNRHVAVELQRNFGGEITSLRRWSRAHAGLRIYNANHGDAISRVLRRHEHLYTSVYTPDHPPGTIFSERDSCQDLEALTFDDESFDVVITEDVLEHVRHYGKALREIRRVLVPGGYHIFTIPFRFDRVTRARVDTTTGEDLLLMDAVYHGDSIRGRILVYTDFGFDLLAELEDMGFSSRISTSKLPDRRWGIVDSLVIVSRKDAVAE